MSETMIGTMQELISQVQQLEAAKAAAEARASAAEAEWFERYQLLESEVFLVGRELGKTVMQNLFADEQKVREEMSGLVEACKKLRSEAQAQAQAQARAGAEPDAAAVGALADNIRARAKNYSESLVKAQKWVEGPGAVYLAQKALEKGKFHWIEPLVGSEEFVRAHVEVLQRVGINSYINDVPGVGFSLKVDMKGVRSWAAASSRGA